MAERSDATLVRMTVENGSQYYGHLVKRHSDYLFGLGMRLGGGRDALAKDVSQQAFIKAFKYLASFNPSHPALGVDPSNRFRNWLTGIAVNCYSDLARSEAKYVGLDEQISEPESRTDRFSHQQSEEFSAIIQPLEMEARQLITLRYVYEFTIDEIAGMLGMKPGTVKSKISRATKRLRESAGAAPVIGDEL